MAPRLGLAKGPACARGVRGPPRAARPGSGPGHACASCPVLAHGRRSGVTLLSLSPASRLHPATLPRPGDPRHGHSASMSTRPRSRFQLCPREGARSPAWGGRRALRTRPPPLALGPSLPRPLAALGPAGRALRTPPRGSPVCHCHSHPAPPLLLRGAPHMAPPFYPVSRGAQRGPWARGSGGPSTSGRSGQADAADAPGARGPPARRGSAGTPPGGPAATSASRGPGRRRRSGRETDAAARRLSAPGRPGHGFLPTPPQPLAAKLLRAASSWCHRRARKRRAGTATSLLRQPGS